MKRRIFVIVLVLIPFVLLFLYFFLLNNRPGTPLPLLEHSEGELRVATLNINWLGFNKKADATARRLAASARENSIDVLLLLEYKEHWNFKQKEFAAIFRKDYPYFSVEDECVCISRYPIKSHKRVKYCDMSGSFSDIKLTIDKDSELRVFAVHLVTTGINSFTNDDVEIVAQGVWSTYFGNSEIRRNQAVSLSEKIGYVRTPLLVMGDFNSVPGSFPYRKMLSASLKDSFLSNGKGNGSTYRYLYDLFRIDYIFYNDDLECISSHIVDDEISDHKMVVSSFLIDNI